MKSNFNYPKKSAFALGAKMRAFLIQTENAATSEVNVNADHDRAEVVRQIDWGKFNDIINQLQYPYIQQQKNKSKQFNN